MKKILIMLFLSFLIVSLIGCQNHYDETDINQKDEKSNLTTSETSLSSETNLPSQNNITESSSQSTLFNEEKINYQYEYVNTSKEEPTENYTIDNQSSETNEISQVISDNENNNVVLLPDGKSPIAPNIYQKLLGEGMDVDWSKTEQGKKYYNPKAVLDFKAAGIHHVRIRIKDKANSDLFSLLDKQIDNCLSNGLIPIIAYQADEFKNEPTQENIDNVVKWWTTVAEHYQNISHLLSFDMLIEATDALNKQPEKLNDIYEQTVTAIRKSNPTRIIMMSPRLRSDPTYLNELKIPTNHNGYMMAEWHFYASGPSKNNDKKLWTTGTSDEKQLITDKINLALEWQKKTGIPTWVGAWMPGNYNDGNNYTIEEQIVFSLFMTKSLKEACIPFAVNSDTKFYDRENNCWISEMQPVFDVIYQ